MSSFGVDDLDEVEVIRAANAVVNMADALPDLPRECPGAAAGGPFRLTYCTSSSLPPKLTLRLFHIFESNMKAIYEQTWGWDRNVKMKELFHPASRFIIVSKTEHGQGLEQGQGQRETVQSLQAENIVAFTMYRFDWDDEDEPEHPVLYCYELQVAPDSRGHGFGRFLMSLLVTIADKLRMWKVMLTCLKHNAPAMAFYLHCGFGIDANSPSSFGHAEEEYEILSNKPLIK